MNRTIKIIIAAILLVAGFWAYQMFGTATISVTSEPSGAIVRVDGRQRGLTPVDRLEVDAGSHRLEIAHTHFKPVVEGLSLQRGDHVERQVQFEPGVGSLVLLSNPRGAWVDVDGERISGRTPVTIDVASGEHVIAMGQEERRIVEQNHTVKHGQKLEVNFDLNIDPHGSLTITTTPRSAKVELISEDVSYTPNMRLQIGEYAIRVSKSGYTSQEFRYKVRYGNNLHQVTLEREFGNLNVSATPAGAEVRVLYQDGGKQRNKTYSKAMRLPVGSVEVRVGAIGYRTQFKRVALTGQGATVRVRLAEMRVQPGEVIADGLKSGGTGPKMVIVPGGSFTVGDPEGPPSERPAHKVSLTQPFAVSQYEITIGQYVAFSQATGRQLHKKLDASNINHAVAYVSHADARAYAKWLSQQSGERYRLLSEAEWEYVARGGTDSHYFWGDDELRVCEYGNVADQATRKRFREWDTVDCNDDMVRPGPVGQFLPNPFGLHDVYGNVAEWVLDCGIPDYAYTPRDGTSASQTSGCATHGMRGGSWDSLAVEVRSSYRNSASSANDDRGIRLMRVL